MDQNPLFCLLAGRKFLPGMRQLPYIYGATFPILIFILPQVFLRRMPSDFGTVLAFVAFISTALVNSVSLAGADLDLQLWRTLTKTRPFKVDLFISRVTAEEMARGFWGSLVGRWTLRDARLATFLCVLLALALPHNPLALPSQEGLNASLIPIVWLPLFNACFRHWSSAWSLFLALNLVSYQRASIIRRVLISIKSLICWCIWSGGAVVLLIVHLVQELPYELGLALSGFWVLFTGTLLTLNRQKQADQNYERLVAEFEKILNEVPNEQEHLRRR